MALVPRAADSCIWEFAIPSVVTNILFESCAIWENCWFIPTASWKLIPKFWATFSVVASKDKKASTIKPIASSINLIGVTVSFRFNFSSFDAVPVLSSLSNRLEPPSVNNCTKDLDFCLSILFLERDDKVSSCKENWALSCFVMSSSNFIPFANRIFRWRAIVFFRVAILSNSFCIFASTLTPLLIWSWSLVISFKELAFCFIALFRFVENLLPNSWVCLSAPSNWSVTLFFIFWPIEVNASSKYPNSSLRALAANFASSISLRFAITIRFYYKYEKE